jgi:PAS domain S-box-containing protein
MKKTSKSQRDTIKKKNSQQEIENWKYNFEILTMISGQIVYDYSIKDGSIKWGGNIEKILGCRPSEMNGGIKQWKKLIHKDDRKESFRLLEIAKKNFTPYEVEYRCKHKDGHYVNFLDRGLFISVSGKKPERMVGIMRDITSSKRSEQLIGALNTAVIEMQKVFSREEVFKVVARELKKMNIESMVLLIDNKKENLYLEYLSYDLKLIKKMEKVAGLKSKDIMFPIENIKENIDVVKYKKTILSNSSEEFIKRILPKNLKFMTKQLVTTFKFSLFILAPLIAEDKVFGAFYVQAEDLIESDIPAVTIFANQLAGAWNKGELIEKIQNDMTKLTITEKALKENEQKSRTIIEQLSEGFALINDKGVIIEWNKAMESITGRKRKDVINTFFWDMQYEHILPERRDRTRYSKYKKMILEALKDKRSAMFNKTFEVPIINMSGEKRVIQSTIFPIFLCEKFFAGNISRDITEQKKIDKENILLAHSLRSVKDAISVTDMNNNVIFVNDAFLETYGYKENEVIGKNISFIGSENNPSNSTVIVEEETKNENWYGELINKRKDGSEFPIELWTSVVKDSNNNDLAMVGIARDITKRKRAEKDIEESNKKLNNAQRVAKIGSWEIFFSPNERYWSENMYEIMGFPPGANVNWEDIEERIVVKEVGKFEKAINDAINAGKPYSMNYKLIMPDGSIKYIHDEGKIIRDKSGKVVSMFGTTQDVTESKLVENALKKSEEHYRSIFENAPLGMYRTTLEGNVISVNPWFVKILGYNSAEDMINTVNSSNISSKVYTDTEKRKQIVKLILQSRDWFTIENQFKRKDGKIVSGVLSLHTIINSRNEQVEIEGFYTDMTKQKQTEENLRRSEKRFMHVAESAEEWIWEVNEEGLFTYSSPVVEKILGYKPEEITNKKHFYDLLIPRIRDEIKAWGFETFGKKEKIKGLINEKLHENGNIIITETTGVPILDDQNNLLGYRGVDKDITERKQAEEELIKAKKKAEEMNMVKSSFLANMSHEVRTPLVAILGFSEVLGEMVKEDELKDYVEMIHKGGERLLETLNLILDLSIIEAHKIEIELSPLDVVGEIKEVAAFFDKTAKRKNLSLKIISDIERIILDLDVKIFRQIMNNLINNAIKYTTCGGVQVNINKEKKDDKSYIAIRVEDTGIGIPKNKRDLIWDEFRQVSEGFNRSFEGTGLGLSITRKFVEKLGGEIFLEKSEVNIGSVFMVLFPIKEKVKTVYT